jgi:hypothetical protein
MNSNTVRIGTFVLIICTLILAAGPLTGLFPGLPAKWAPLVGLLILGLKEWLMSILTPATNSRTPDNTPPKPPSP